MWTWGMGCWPPVFATNAMLSPSQQISGAYPMNKRTAVDKNGTPLYPGAAPVTGPTYPQPLAVHQPFVPLSCEYFWKNPLPLVNPCFLSFQFTFPWSASQIPSHGTESQLGQSKKGEFKRNFAFSTVRYYPPVAATQQVFSAILIGQLQWCFHPRPSILGVDCSDGNSINHPTMFFSPFSLFHSLSICLVPVSNSLWYPVYRCRRTQAYPTPDWCWPRRMSVPGSHLSRLV